MKLILTACSFLFIVFPSLNLFGAEEDIHATCKDLKMTEYAVKRLLGKPLVIPFTTYPEITLRGNLVIIKFAYYLQKCTAAGKYVDFHYANTDSNSRIVVLSLGNLDEVHRILGKYPHRPSAELFTYQMSQKAFLNLLKVKDTDTTEFTLNTYVGDETGPFNFSGYIYSTYQASLTKEGKLQIKSLETGIEHTRSYEICGGRIYKLHCPRATSGRSACYCRN